LGVLAPDLLRSSGESAKSGAVLSSHYHLMSFVTDFADQAVVLPVVLAIGLTLLLQGWRRGAAVWGAVILGTFAAMLVLKLLFIPCGVEDFHTPSGHVASATVVAGGLAAMLRHRLGIIFPAAMLAAFVVGVSRLMLGMHTWPEVVMGALVGVAGALVLERLAGPPPPSLEARKVVLVAFGVAVLFHGLHLPAEAEIRSTAWRLAWLFDICQGGQARL
jgi:membrane-associated phospholipid phosphatase